ncbi:hypothetical protein DOTSEDRAFT_71694 [Lecanosticta acicola]|uniref:Acyltransferase 3 domain-containing protein n=1 Tax=Lecanosticta acicola TaxID=111012 RepID=A0AAI8Z7U9_9PEZI|nr:hypothetical protein DOTSEDRAFT_71694 [Lecanosticta acicola]
MPESSPREKSLGLLEQGDLEVDSDSTLNEDDRPPTPVAKTRAQLAQLMELGASRLAVLRPSFMTVKNVKPGKLRKTAYLDGMRGFAALLVYFLHHGLWAHAISGGSTKLENTFGWDGEYYLGAFPVIRTFFTGGHYAVSTFFVLSGYVLAMKPLTQIHEGQYLQLGDSMASGLFRRWIRLFLPIWIVTFCFLLLPHVFGIHSDFKPQGNLGDEIWKWYCDLKNFTFIWNTGGEWILDYHKHVWSIPVEFKGSITIFTACLAFSRCTRNARLWCQVGLIFYFMWIVDGAHFAMFQTGMLICDLDLLAEKKQLPSWFYSLEPFKTPIFYTMFAVSVLMGGVPSNSAETSHLRESPGWYYLSFLKPQAVFDYRWFFLYWASILLVGSVRHIHWLKAFFETRACQFLGRHSYMFYLMHGPILWTLGDRLYAAVGWVNFSHALIIPGWADSFPLPKWGPFGLEFAYVVPQMILLPTTLWVASLMTAIVDDPSVKFAAYCYSLTQPSKEDREQLEQRKA